MPASQTDFAPFDPERTADYRAWRAWKLDGYPAGAERMLVEVRDPARLSTAEHRALHACLRKANMVIYQVTGPHAAGKAELRALGRQLGLERLDMNLRADEDSITSIRVVPEQAGTHYIPYTSRPLNWHTDGYYNRPEQAVRAILMHCVRPAASGGENRLLDPEIAYILLRDENPDYIRALMRPDAMTIPANVEDGNEIRADRSGPVFSLENATGALHMRYTARTRSIRWNDDAVLQQAVRFLGELLNSNIPWLIRHRLRAGQGIICNNVIHRREAFSDDPERPRLLYRARYHDRVPDTVAGPECSGELRCSG